MEKKINIKKEQKKTMLRFIRNPLYYEDEQVRYVSSVQAVSWDPDMKSVMQQKNLQLHEYLSQNKSMERNDHNYNAVGFFSLNSVRLLLSKEIVALISIHCRR